MANTIKLKRGIKSRLPRLEYGEPAYVSDEGELYIGSESGNVKLTHKSEIEDLNTQINSITNFINSSMNVNEINNIISTSNVIRFLKGTYTLDILNNPIVVGDNKIIEFENGVIININPTNTNMYRIFRIDGNNVTLKNPVINGDKLNNNTEQGEWGHGITISGKNVEIINPIIKNCHGDGIYINGVNCENVIISNPIVDNCSRNGITIIQGKNIKILSPLCKNMNGAPPQSGIGIEPNNSNEILENIEIINPKTYNNLGFGIYLNFDKIGKTMDKNITITIDNPYDYGSYNSFGISSLENTGSSTGYIKFLNPVSEKAQLSSFFIDNYAQEKSAILILDKPKCINCNTSLNTSPQYGSAIVITRQARFTSSTGYISNIEINEPAFIDTNTVATLKKCIYVSDSIGVNKFKDIFIKNPITTIHDTTYDLTNILTNINGIKCVDNISKFTITDFSGSVFGNVFNYIAKDSMCEWLLRSTIIPSDNIFEFVNLKGNYVSIQPQNGKILGINTEIGKKLHSVTIGDVLRIKKINETDYIVISKIGNWTETL